MPGETSVLPSFGGGVGVNPRPGGASVSPAFGGSCGVMSRPGGTWLGLSHDGDLGAKPPVKETKSSRSLWGISCVACGQRLDLFACLGRKGSYSLEGMPSSSANKHQSRIATRRTGSASLYASGPGFRARTCADRATKKWNHSPFDCDLQARHDSFDGASARYAGWVYQSSRQSQLSRALWAMYARQTANHHKCMPTIGESPPVPRKTCLVWFDAFRRWWLWLR